MVGAWLSLEIAFFFFWFADLWSWTISVWGNLKTIFVWRLCDQLWNHCVRQEVFSHICEEIRFLFFFFFKDRRMHIRADVKPDSHPQRPSCKFCNLTQQQHNLVFSFFIARLTWGFSPTRTWGSLQPGRKRLQTCLLSSLRWPGRCSKMSPVCRHPGRETRRSAWRRLKPRYSW